MNKRATIGFILFAFGSIDLMAQCDADKFSSACVARMPDGFKLLKSYNLDNQGGAKQMAEYSYVFTKGTQYVMNLCEGDQNSGNIAISLLDSRHEPVISDKYNEHSPSIITYTCTTTGIYYLHYTFGSTASICAGSALGFKPAEHYATVK